MIHARGYWTEEAEVSTHVCDEPLCAAIIELYKDVKTAVDIGCGNGKYTKNLIDAGIDCKGFDGSPLTPAITNGICGVMDFSLPTDIGQFDLILCLEVGEHIPAHYEEVFIENLVRASKKHICLSWGIEGQDGWGHVNCRNNDYVIDKMKGYGFRYLEKPAQALRDSSTFWWFKNTVMVFEL